MQRSIDPTLFEWPSAHAHLIGSECNVCGVVSFPSQSSCPSCCGSDVMLRALSRTGRLWTWTTQSFAPKSPPYAVTKTPETFAPFYLGYVELENEVIVESRIEPGDRPLSIDMPMELTFAPLFVDENGDEVMCFAFKPSAEAA